MRAKFGGDPTAGSKNLAFKFNNRYPVMHTFYGGIQGHLDRVCYLT